MNETKMTWLARDIFSSIPSGIGALKLYTLDCGCIYCRRVFPDGTIAKNYGIYRNAEDGPCGRCMNFGETWKDRVEDEVVVYRTNIRIE